MSKEEAYNILVKATGTFNGTRDQHDIIRQALLVVKAALSPAPEEPKKEEVKEEKTAQQPPKKSPSKK